MPDHTDVQVHKQDADYNMNNKKISGKNNNIRIPSFGFR
jgi:hypothetical protein